MQVLPAGNKKDLTSDERSEREVQFHPRGRTGDKADGRTADSSGGDGQTEPARYRITEYK